MPAQPHQALRAGHPSTGSQLTPSPAPEEAPASTTPQAAGTTTDMRAAFLVLLLLWAVAWAHPVPGHQPARARRRAQQEDTASEDYINNLGNLLGGGDGRHPPVSAERGDHALAGDPAGGNTVGEELGEQGGQNKGGRTGEAQHLNQVDHEDTSARDGNGLGFLEEGAGDADGGDHREYHGTGVHGLPSHADGLLEEEEDDSGDDTLDEERGEGPTYVPGADGAGEQGHDVAGGAGTGHGDTSSSSSSSESVGADHRSYLSSQRERTYRWGGGSSSSQEDEESYNLEDEAMQGDDPSVFDSPSSSYKGHRVGPRAPGSSRESVLGAGSHGWEEDDSRSPEVEGTDSGEDSPSTEDNSQSEEPVASQSEENSASPSRENGEDSPSREDGEDSPSREDEDSKSREGIADQSDEEPGESPEDMTQEVVGTSSERSSSRSWEEQEDQETAEDRSAPSTPDSESGEDEGDQSKSTEDTVEESKENENDSTPDGHVLSTSDESQSASSEDDGSQEDNTGEDSRSPESDNSESQEANDDDDDEEEESHSQEDATRESSSRGDDSSLQSLESGSRKRRVGAYRHKPAADYDDNDCQDGY